MTRALIGPALCALALAATAPALAASHDRDTFIAQQDLTSDGRVSKDEYAAGRDKEFAGMDANHDGGISRAEYIADFKTRLLDPEILPKTPANRREEERVREMRQADVRFDVLDTDKSGAITPAEFAYSGWSMFIHHDTNKDGFVGKDDPIAKDDN